MNQGLKNDKKEFDLQKMNDIMKFINEIMGNTCELIADCVWFLIFKVDKNLDKYITVSTKFETMKNKFNQQGDLQI